MTGRPHITAEELKSFALFDGMTDEQLATSAEMFEPVKRVAGERVTKEDDFGYSLFLILQGRFAIEVDGQKVAELGEGDHFGEVSLVTGNRRNATVRAMEMSVLGKIMYWDFEELGRLNPDLALRIQAAAEARS